ncbi:glycosyltransferase family 4 protein [Crocinitomix algicola]|uniref:glycosyltransferase family 4 protein n=1 Tax=Crocinitomix algicola TaxID=1740263 RepID=UPI000833981B|nr:glycosyltransferase family 4 protein [Crocinitomix algicola]
MKILLITDGITPYVTGGMQRHSANLAKYFTLQGVEVTLVHCVSHHQSIPSETDVNKELFGDTTTKLDKIIGLHFPKPGKFPGHYIRNSYKYSQLVYESIDFSQFDFIYAKGYTAWHALALKKKDIKLPPIGVKFHGYEMFQDMPSLKQKIESKLLKKPTKWNNENADYIFSYGGKITDLILKEFKVKRENVLDFTSGLNSDWLRNDIQSSQSPLKFVFMGRDEERKGLKDLNSVLENLPTELTYEFHFIGPIPKEKQLKDPKFTYHGQLNSKSEICDILDNMDVLVCPSHAEGMPNVILEGMARGLAIVATDTGAVEMLVDHTNGFCIPTHDANALTSALLNLINTDLPRLENLRRRSLQKIKTQFLWNSLIKNMIMSIESKL